MGHAVSRVQPAPDTVPPSAPAPPTELPTPQAKQHGHVNPQSPHAVRGPSAAPLSACAPMTSTGGSHASLRLRAEAARGRSSRWTRVTTAANLPPQPSGAVHDTDGSGSGTDDDVRKPGNASVGSSSTSSRSHVSVHGDVPATDAVFHRSFAVVMGLPAPSPPPGVAVPLGRRVRLVASELRRQGFQVVSRVVGKSATKPTVLAALGALLDACRAAQTAAAADGEPVRVRVLVYVVGYAATVQDTFPSAGSAEPPSTVPVPVLCCAGARLGDAAATADTCLPVHYLGMLVRRLPASHQMLVMDGCRGASMLATHLLTPATALAGQYTAGVPVVKLDSDGPVVGRPNLLHQPPLRNCLQHPAVCVLGCDLAAFPDAPQDAFTRAFVNGIAGDAFIAGRGFLTASLLFAYLHAKMVAALAPTNASAPKDKRASLARVRTVRGLTAAIIKPSPSFRRIALARKLITPSEATTLSSTAAQVVDATKRHAVVEFGFVSVGAPPDWTLHQPPAPPPPKAASPPLSRRQPPAPDRPPPAIRGLGDRGTLAALRARTVPVDQTQPTPESPTSVASEPGSASPAASAVSGAGSGTSGDCGASSLPPSPLPPPSPTPQPPPQRLQTTLPATRWELQHAAASTDACLAHGDFVFPREPASMLLPPPPCMPCLPRGAAGRLPRVPRSATTPGLLSAAAQGVSNLGTHVDERHPLADDALSPTRASVTRPPTPPGRAAVATYSDATRHRLEATLCTASSLTQPRLMGLAPRHQRCTQDVYSAAASGSGTAPLPPASVPPATGLRLHRRAMAAVRRFVTSNYEDTRFLVLHGPSGCGKTTLAAHVVDAFDDRVAARVFLGPRSACGHGRRLLAGFVKSLCLQLAARVPHYAKLLGVMGGAFMRRLVEQDNPSALFTDLIRKPLMMVPRPRHTMVVVVDGVDQVTGLVDGYSLAPPSAVSHTHPVLQLLQLQWLRMPMWLGVVATATDVGAAASCLAPLSPKYVTLDGLDHRNCVDEFMWAHLAPKAPAVHAQPGPAAAAPARTSARRRRGSMAVALPSARHCMTARQMLPVLGALSDKARGSFLYATLALRYGARVQFDAAAMAALPPTTTGLFQLIVESFTVSPPNDSGDDDDDDDADAVVAAVMAADTDDGADADDAVQLTPATLSAVLSVVFASVVPLTAEAVAVAAPVSPAATADDVLAVCDAVAPLLYVAPDDTIRPAFVAVKAWLASDACPQQFRADVAAGHAALARACLTQLRAGHCGAEAATDDNAWDDPERLDVDGVRPVVAAEQPPTVHFSSTLMTNTTSVGSVPSHREPRWQALESRSFAAYALLAAPHHIRTVGDDVQLCRLLCSPDYVQLMAAAGLLSWYARECHLAVSQLSSMPPPMRARFRAYAAVARQHHTKLRRRPALAAVLCAAANGMHRLQSSRMLPPLSTVTPVGDVGADAEVSDDDGDAVGDTTAEAGGRAGAGLSGMVRKTSSMHSMQLRNTAVFQTGLKGPLVRVPVTDRSDALVFVMKGHSAAVNAVAFVCSPSSNAPVAVVSGSDDETVRLWTAATGEPWNTLHGHGWGVKGVAVAQQDGSRLVTGSWDGTVRVWSVDTGKSLVTMRGNLGYIRSVAVSADGSRVVAGSMHQRARVFDALGRPLATLRGHMDTISGVSITHDGNFVLTCSDDQTVRVWSLATGKCVRVLGDYPVGVEAVAVSQNGRVVTGAWDGSVRVWDLHTGECMSQLLAHRSWVTSIAVDADATRVVSGSEDGTVRVWDLDAITAALRSVTILAGHAGEVAAVCLSNDRHVVGSGGRDGTVRVWELR